ncbi:MAG: chemotaxis protein CheA [Phycisphaerales bacterium JB063]
MSELNIGTLVNRLAEQLVMAEPEDMPLLGKAHADLVQLGQCAGSMGTASIQRWATAAADTIERIIFREHADPAGALADITEFISELQTESHKAGGWEGVADAPPSANESVADQPAVESAITTETDEHPEPEAAAPSAPAVPAEEHLSAAAAFTIQSDPDLLSDFIGEAREHLEQVDTELLTLESDASDTEAINAVFRAFHTIKGVAGFLDLPPVQLLAHETETLLDKARKGQLTLAGLAMDVTFESNDLMKVLIENVAQAAAQGGSVPETPELPALLAKICEASHGEDAGQATSVARDVQPKEEASAEDDFFGSEAAPTQARDATPDATEDAAQPQSTKQSPPAGKPSAVAAPTPAQAEPPAKQRFSGMVQETIKVDALRLDSLVDTIGEMVIAEAMVRQSFAGSESDRMRVPQILGQLDKITRELQELAMSLRMVPVKSTFQRMARLARDTSKKLGKPITFVTSGDETELDKTVVDVIGDPLVHMIRNAIDHGLEAAPADRVAAGKPEEGRIELRARHQGGSIIIEICDDGRGLDRDVILAKAKERGLVQDGHALSDHEVFNLIFEPGFSTAKQVSDVSGRGVGLDVVKKNIQSLRGKVEITSEPGRGSTFSIRLPLTLAIIEGMVVRAGSQRYIIPTLSITRMLRHNAEDVSTVLRRDEMLMVGGDLIPMFHLDRLFGLRGDEEQPAGTEIVVVEDEGRNYALVIDEILGQQQIVIKPLGPMFRQGSGVSGGAIMPDGRVGLILDITGLIAMTGHKTQRAAA